MPARLTSLKASSPSRTNLWLSIAVVRTTQSSWQPADSEPAVQEVVQPWEPRFVPRETALEIVKYLLRRKPMRLNPDVGQQRHWPQVLSNGAHPDAMSGGTRDAVTIQCATGREAEHAGGWTISQVDPQHIITSLHTLKDSPKGIRYLAPKGQYFTNFKIIMSPRTYWVPIIYFWKPKTPLGVSKNEKAVWVGWDKFLYDHLIDLLILIKLLCREDLSTSWQPAPRQLELWDAGDSDPRNLLPRQRCTVLSGYGLIELDPLMTLIFSTSMSAGVRAWLCCPADTSYHLCQWGICKRVSLLFNSWFSYPHIGLTFTFWELQQ